MLNLSYYDDDEEEESGDEESYLASYSDLVTDLMATFVLLLSFALLTVSGTIASAKAQQSASTLGIDAPIAVVQTTHAGEGNQDADGSQAMDGTTPQQEDDLEKLLRAIQSYIEAEGLSDQLHVVRNGNHQILLRVDNSALFASGKADITQETAQMLQKISDIFTRYEQNIYMVRIEGHTDNQPIKTSQFDSNWELSTSRAVNILRWLQEASQMSANKFSAVGYGEFQPIADNATPQGRSENRRVDFIIEVQTPQTASDSSTPS